jgi:tetratricopeptide (TPR) repeat protein
MDQAQKYFQLISQQIPVPDAIKQAFNMTPAEFDEEIKKFPVVPKIALASTSSSIPTLLSAPTVDDAAFTVQQLSPLAVDATLADVHLHEPGYHTKAIKEFETLLVKDPLNTTAFRGLGLDSLRHGDLAGAEKHFQKAIEVDPKNWLSHYYMALELQQRANPYTVKQLEQEARLVTELNPEFGDGFAIMGSALVLEQKLKEAVTAYQNALRLSPANESYSVSLAMIYMSQDKFDDAKTIFVGLENSRDRRVASMAKTYLQALSVQKKGPSNN